MPEKNKSSVENLSASTRFSTPAKQTPEELPEMSRQLLNKIRALQIVPDIFINDIAPACHCVVQYEKHKVQDATDTPIMQHEAAARPRIHLMPFDMVSDIESSLASGSSSAHAQQVQHFYDVFMVDPDAPSNTRPSAREWLHMVIANVPLGFKSSIHGAARELLLDEGEELIKYAGPTPPEGTGYHRYCFFVFRHAGRNDMKHKLNWRDMKRASFRTEEFALKAGLGQPTACASFICKHEKI